MKTNIVKEKQNHSADTKNDYVAPLITPTPSYSFLTSQRYAFFSNFRNGWPMPSFKN